MAKLRREQIKVGTFTMQCTQSCSHQKHCFYAKDQGEGERDFEPALEFEQYGNQLVIECLSYQETKRKH